METSDSERDRALDEARRALRELAIARRDLVVAIEELGKQFESEAVLAAWRARREDADASRRINAINWPLGAAVNQLNTIFQAGTVLAGLRAAADERSVSDDLARLERSGALTSEQRRRLSRLNQLRNVLQHDYGLNDTPEAIHEAAQLARQVLSNFADDFGEWLRELHVVPRP